MSGNIPQPVYPSSLFRDYSIAFEGGSIACILYGAYLALAGMNLVLLQKRKYSILLLYSIVQLVITTLCFAVPMYTAPAQSLAIFGIVDFYSPNAMSLWPSVVVNVGLTLNTWFSDGFLLYRCYIVCMRDQYTIVFLSLIYLATIGASIAWLVVSSAPGTVYSIHTVQATGISYWSISVAMTVCASSLIFARLWKHQQAIARIVGSPQGTFYMEMMLESAVLYAVFVIIMLVVFTLNSPLENVFLPVLVAVQAIAPSLIIYRIARETSLETGGHESIATGSLRFALSLRPRATPRPFHDATNVSSTTQVFSGDSADNHPSNSFTKDKV